jgi:hypothetical protein
MSRRWHMMPGMNTPRLSCIRLTAPMHPSPVLLAKKRPHTSLVEEAANSTLASCNGACSRNRICGGKGQGQGEGGEVGVRAGKQVPHA